MMRTTNNTHSHRTTGDTDRQTDRQDKTSGKTMATCGETVATCRVAHYMTPAGRPLLAVCVALLW